MLIQWNHTKIGLAGHRRTRLTGTSTMTGTGPCEVATLLENDCHVDTGAVHQDSHLLETGACLETGGYPEKGVTLLIDHLRGSDADLETDIHLELCVTLLIDLLLRSNACIEADDRPGLYLTLLSDAVLETDEHPDISVTPLSDTVLETGTFLVVDELLMVDEPLGACVLIMTSGPEIAIHRAPSGLRMLRIVIAAACRGAQAHMRRCLATTSPQKNCQ